MFNPKVLYCGFIQPYAFYLFHQQYLVGKIFLRVVFGTFLLTKWGGWGGGVVAALHNTP